MMPLFFIANKQTKITQEITAVTDVDWVMFTRQSLSQFSGGEAHVLKLASFLVKEQIKDKVLFVS
jgi:excinuclease UvrABC ATPase subunit